jgi:hypothetical protein
MRFHPVDSTFFADLGKEQFQQFTNGVGAAFVSFANHTSSFQAALGQMAKSAIDSLAAQSISQALYWTAVGLADTAVGDAQGATDAFAAATLFGEVAAVSGALALAAGAGGSGKSSSSNPGTQQGFSGGSNTGGPQRSGTSVSGVQHFAEGGLITAPTLAMIGEQNRKEAVLPLEDPQAMGAIGEALGGAGGGGVHIHLPHGSIISADVMQKFVAKMNKMVNRGQLSVHSSSTFRTNKRSA